MKPKVLIFYKNGVHLEGFPIFYFGSHDAVSLIADLLDGYFPRQLEKSFPDGVLLEVVDKLDELYDEKKPSSRTGIWDSPGRDMKPVSQEEFLKKLPEKVIREGKIFEIRKGVQDHLNKINSKPAAGPKAGSKLRGVVQNEAGDWVVQNEFLLDEKYRDSPDLSHLKVRLDFLSESLIVFVSKDMKLKDLHGVLVKCLADKSKQYKLVNGFPRTEFDLASDLSLEAHGLYPRAAIYMQEQV